ncbi:MAG: hypothetical protein JXA95_11580 [Spirochaetales bacterium]|nr:hypothetical protein [Spirochaetales bacterium]
MTAARELAVDEILVTWNEGEETPTSLLSCLNVYLDFISGYDRFLAGGAGWDCEVHLVLDRLEERGFRFTLSYDLIPSSQLYLGQSDVMEDILEWLVQMHEELLRRLLSLSREEDLDDLLQRARRRAEESSLAREFLFTLDPSPRRAASLEKRYAEVLAARDELAGRVTLKIQKK